MIEAPVNAPKTTITAATVIPIDKPANPGSAFLSTATPITTSTRKNVPINSANIACAYPTPKPGAVAPSPPIVTAALPKHRNNAKLPRHAPIT